MIAILSSPDTFQKKGEMDKIRSIINDGSGIIHYEVKNFHDIGEALDKFQQCKVSAIVIIGGQAISSATFEYLIDNNPFENKKIPIAVLSGDDGRLISQFFGSTSNAAYLDLAKVLLKHQAGRLLDSVFEIPVMKIEGVKHIDKLYGLFFCTGDVIKKKYLFNGIIHRSGIRQVIQTYKTIFSLTYKAYLQSYKSDKIDNMIRVSRNQRGAVVCHYFMVMLSSLNWMLLGAKLPQHKKYNTMSFMSIENTKDAILNTCKRLLKGNYNDAALPGHVVTEVDHARLVFKKQFVVDGCYYETDDNGELQITVADKLSFIQLS
jgi:hypothetical protein